MFRVRVALRGYLLTNSRIWTVLDLAELAVKADALEVLHILVDYCRGTVYNNIIYEVHVHVHSGGSRIS